MRTSHFMLHFKNLSSGVSHWTHKFYHIHVFHIDCSCTLWPLYYTYNTIAVLVRILYCLTVILSLLYSFSSVYTGWALHSGSLVITLLFVDKVCLDPLSFCRLVNQNSDQVPACTRQTSGRCQLRHAVPRSAAPVVNHLKPKRNQKHRSIQNY